VKVGKGAEAQTRKHAAGETAQKEFAQKARKVPRFEVKFACISATCVAA
jgi:hypothetical protein